jgi:hypothetical protein
MTEQDYINTVTRIYRTDRLGQQPRGWYTTPEQVKYLGNFVGLLSRGGRLRIEAIKAEEEARIANLVTRFEQHDATITVVTK